MNSALTRRQQRRRRRLLRAGAGVTSGLVLAGMVFLAVAVFLASTNPRTPVGDSGADVSSSSPPISAATPAPQTAPQTGAQVGERTSVAPVVPAGIVTRTDPAWVLRVSDASGIPARAVAAYAGADLYARAEWGCSVGWNTLAGIGLVETEHGTGKGGAIDADNVARPTILGIALDGTASAAIPDTDAGALDGDPVWDRAVGPMQFIPQTWAQWGIDGDEDGKADINNIVDASLTAARYLCQARGTLDYAAAWVNAIRSYNNDPQYQDHVAEAARYYAGFTGG